MIIMRSLFISTIVLLGCCYAISSAVADSASDNDLKVLNYALTLEHLEATFYNTFQAKFSSDDFANAGYESHLYDYLTVIQSHENAHVAALTSTIQQLGGTAIGQCHYNFSSVTDPKSYIATARLLENTGQSAYDGALNHLTSTQLQAAAASIATVEARHASFLNKVQGAVPFPNVTDPALSPSEVINAAKGFFIDCAGSTDFSGLISTVRPNGVTGAPSSSIPVDVQIPNNGQTYTADQKGNDLKVLNYALTLEHLESAFYNMYQTQFSSDDFVKAGYNPLDYSYFNLIQSHENGHVKALTATISAYGGNPVPACTYNFPVRDVYSYIATSKLLENTGVMAYDGAANLISDVILQQVAATIDTVEARHAAFLNNIVDPNGASAPFPNATDPSQTPANILKAASSFIASCPYNINDPNSLPGPAPSAPSQPSNTPKPSNTTASSSAPVTGASSSLPSPSPTTSGTAAVHIINTFSLAGFTVVAAALVMLVV